MTLAGAALGSPPAAPHFPSLPTASVLLLFRAPPCLLDVSGSTTRAIPLGAGSVALLPAGASASLTLADKAASASPSEDDLIVFRVHVNLEAIAK